MSKILITGATGFLGNALCKNLKFNKHSIQISLRLNNKIPIEGLKRFFVGEINSKTRWGDSLSNVDCIIHCASIKYEMKEKKNALAFYRKINVEGTRNLAEQAAALGVRRLIFLSSAKVNGEKTIGLSTFKYNDTPKPETVYSISKLETEQVLTEVSMRTGLEIVIIRAPLIYGEWVGGNFLSLLNLIHKGIPLPFARVQNSRSFISLDNLISLIDCCIDHPKAAGKIFLVSDNEDVSTPELIKKLACIMQKSPRLFPVSISIIKLISRLVGKSLEVERLISSLRVDSSYTSNVLGWIPPFSLNKSLEKTVNWYLRNL